MLESLELHADGDFSIEEGNVDGKVQGNRRIKRFVIADEFLGVSEDSKTTHISGAGKSLQDVLKEARQILEKLEGVIPIVVVSLGSSTVSTKHYGTRNVRDAIKKGREDPFILAAVAEVSIPFEKFKNFVEKEREGIVAFAYLCPCPQEQGYEVSQNGLDEQELLSKVFVCLNEMIGRMNMICTPNIKKYLEAQGPIPKVFMRNRQQKKIRHTRYQDMYPKAEYQGSMWKECIRVLDILERWQEGKQDLKKELVNVLGQ